MRVISKRRLKEFGERHPDAHQPLLAWHQTVRSARWRRPDEVKATYKTASILKDNRICFNIGGNKYRLIVRVNYAVGILYVRWIGSHRDYDDLDANSI
jgi:mRNA interferase HigB